MGKMMRRFDGGGNRPVSLIRRSPPCIRRHRKQPSHKLVWVPAIPSWEKEFCYKIGRFEWENFLEAKKLTEFTPKIFEWNDSAAEEAFRSAKDRFFAQSHGLPNPQCSGFIPSPDLYIDEINWDNHDEDGFNLDGLKELGEISDQEEENYSDCYCIQIEDIKPTGWDVDPEEISRGRVLTGLVVGG